MKLSTLVSLSSTVYAVALLACTPAETATAKKDLSSDAQALARCIVVNAAQPGATVEGVALTCGIQAVAEGGQLIADEIAIAKNRGLPLDAGGQ